MHYSVTVQSINFHIYVLSNAKAGLYRTLLSIWKLDPRPTGITFMTGRGLTTEIEKSIFTVSEDTSDSGPDLKIREVRRDLQVEILEDTLESTFQISGFISERDMFLPNYSELIEGNYGLSALNTFSYYQRMKFGNSRVIHTNNQTKVPLSASVMSNDFIRNSIMNTNFFENLEISSPQPTNVIEGRPKVIIQSNVRSAFDL